jgi:hypothetical protein
VVTKTMKAGRSNKPNGLVPDARSFALLICYRRVLNRFGDSLRRAARRFTLQGVRADTRRSRPMSDEDQRRPAPTLDLEIMMAIGRELRRTYADIIAEGVRERFAEILHRLDEPGNEGSKNHPTRPTI